MPGRNTYNMRRETEGVAVAGSILFLTVILTLVVFPNMLLCISHYRHEKSHLPLTLAELQLSNDDGEGAKPEILFHGKEKRSYLVRRTVYREHLAGKGKEKEEQLIKHSIASADSQSVAMVGRQTDAKRTSSL